MLAQASYREVGTLQNVVNGWSGEEPATPCIPCEKAIIDRGSDDRLPCFILYLVLAVRFVFFSVLQAFNSDNRL